VRVAIWTWVLPPSASVAYQGLLYHSFTAGAIIIASSYSVAQIIIGRLVLGVGVGGAAVIAPL
jgi:hypothetical protein